MTLLIYLNACFTKLGNLVTELDNISKTCRKPVRIFESNQVKPY